MKANARRFAANIRPIIEEIMRVGATSHNAIAAKLNERNMKTARGGTWTHVQGGAILHPFAIEGASVVAACSARAAKEIQGNRRYFVTVPSAESVKVAPGYRYPGESAWFPLNCNKMPKRR